MNHDSFVNKDSFKLVPLFTPDSRAEQGDQLL